MAKMKRTLCITTITRGDETDVRVGNFSVKTLLKEGWTIGKSELVECAMTLEDFYKHSTHVPLSGTATEIVPGAEWVDGGEF